MRVHHQRARSPPAAAGHPKADAVLLGLLVKADAGEQLVRPLLSLAAGHVLDRRAARVTLSIAFRCGKRLNCWKTMPMRCRTPETSTRFAVISSPSRKIRPESIGSSRLTQRSSVLFPLPLTDDDEHLALIDGQIDAVEDDEIAEALLHRLEPHHRCGAGCRCCLLHSRPG